MLLTHKTVKQGDTVLILGASGGVGTGCVSLAKMLGAEVIACASSATKLQRLKELGADHVLNYQEVDFSLGATRMASRNGVRTTGGSMW
jgi:alcohol dehydrogenase